MKMNVTRVKAVVMAGILSAGMLLGGCGKKASMWEMKFDDVKVDLSTSQEEVLAELIDNDISVVNAMRLYVYDEDGDESDLNALDIDRDKMLYMDQFEEDDVKGYYIMFDSTYKIFKKFESADGVNKKTDEDDLPKAFLFLDDLDIAGSRSTNDLHTYTAIVVDGQYLDMSKYVKKLPDEITEDDVDDIHDMTRDMGRLGSELGSKKFISSAYMDPEDIVDDYEDDEAIKNEIAILYALNDLQKDLEDGKIKNFGTISYSFVNGDLDSFKYYIVTED